MVAMDPTGYRVVSVSSAWVLFILCLQKMLLRRGKFNIADICSEEINCDTHFLGMAFSLVSIS